MYYISLVVRVFDGAGACEQPRHTRIRRRRGTRKASAYRRSSLVDREACVRCERCVEMKEVPGQQSRVFASRVPLQPMTSWRYSQPARARRWLAPCTYPRASLHMSFSGLLQTRRHAPAHYSVSESHFPHCLSPIARRRHVEVHATHCNVCRPTLCGSPKPERLGYPARLPESACSPHLLSQMGSAVVGYNRHQFSAQSLG